LASINPDCINDTCDASISKVHWMDYSRAICNFSRESSNQGCFRFM